MTIPADQTEVTAEDVCAAILVDEFPFEVEELVPTDHRGAHDCMIYRADADDTVTVTCVSG